MGNFLNYSMKKLQIFLVVIFTFNINQITSQQVRISGGTVDISRFNKKLLKDLAQEQSLYINQLIEDKRELNKRINDLESLLKISQNNLNVSNNELKKYTDLYYDEMDKVAQLRTENNKISILENEILILKDSILTVNSLLNTYQSQINQSSNTSSNISSSYDSFLNDLYLGITEIENQTLDLKPAGIIAVNYVRYFTNDDNFSNSSLGNNITQFFDISEIDYHVEKRINKELFNTSDIENWKSFIESNMLSSSRAGDIFPTFSFIKGKLLTINSENFEKNFLFSVKEHEYEKTNDYYYNNAYRKTRYSGQKPIYFSLTDEDEKEHLFGTILINNEVYLMLSKNDLINLGLSFKTSNELSRNTILKKVNSSDYSNEYTYESDYDDPLCYNSNTGSYMACRDRRYYIYNDLNTIYIKTKKTLFRESSIVDPIFILFKLELQ
jgi:hypothetical protein